MYHVDAAEPCHLVELLVDDSIEPFDIGKITQPDPTRPEVDWQVPYAEKLLSPEGDAIVWDFWDGPPDDSVWVGTVRLVFFLHYLNLGRSVRTPWGELALPVAESLPERLASIRYESP